MREPRTGELPPAQYQHSEAWTGLNRDAMRADAAAALSWLGQSAPWTLLDQTVTPLLGRSPLRICSALFSAVIDLPDEELAVLVWLLVDRLGAYAEDYPAPLGLGDDELAAIAAFRGAVAGAFGL